MIQIALLGYGTVGRGVVHIFEENADVLRAQLGEEACIKSILVRRDYPGDPNSAKFVKDFAQIENDPDIQAVVEVMGGVEPAFDYTSRALRAGKQVVTANKQLVAERGQELLELAKANDVNYFFEASVGGGIPILRPLHDCLNANRVYEIFGILNGTTNYILTEMIQCGAAFDQTLAQAQELGYAEADPTADVEGYDAMRKTCILADLISGHHTPPELVETQGISGVTSLDVAYARRLGCAIKLLGHVLVDESGKVTAYVAPHFVPRSNPVAGVDGVMNGIVVRGNMVGECLFYGPGAGSLATASAVVADVLDALKHRHRRKDWGWAPCDPAKLQPASKLASRWFVRTSADLAALGAAFGNVDFVTIPDSPAGEYAFVTDAMDGETLDKCAAALPITAKYRILD